MYAEAFFESDPVKIVEAGLACIPAKSQYAECIGDVLQWHKANPDDWQATWELIEKKYQDNTDYRRFSCGGPTSDFNIDAKINGAYIVMGLLYGNGDLDKTIVISTRCGQDSDCNPANSGGILFTTVGYSKLPERFTSELNPEGVFSHTAYNFPSLVKVCEKLVREAVVQQGGRIEKEADGREVFVIPVEKPKPTALEQCWEPGPIADSRFTEEEMEQIEALAGLKKWQQDLEEAFPGWKLASCGPDMDPGLRSEYRGKKNVFMSHPLNKAVGSKLVKTIEVPAGKKTTLHLVVTHDTRGDFTLIVKAGAKELLKKPINTETAEHGWAELDVDLSPFAGKEIELELINQADGWQFEAAYWAEIAVKTSD
jgi:hypothetical protein